LVGRAGAQAGWRAGGGAGAVQQPCAAFVCVVFVLRSLLEKAATTK